MKILLETASGIVWKAPATSIEALGFALVNVPSIPAYFLPGAWRFDGAGWHVHDQAAIDAHPWPAAEQAPAVPQSITARQARLVLLGAGLLASIDAAIATLPEPQRSAAQIEWEYGTSIERHSPMLTLLAPALGLSEPQLDALFVQAAAL